eukprot:621775-Amphidinium_carterae.1
MKSILKAESLCTELTTKRDEKRKEKRAHGRETLQMKGKARRNSDPALLSRGQLHMRSWPGLVEAGKMVYPSKALRCACKIEVKHIRTSFWAKVLAYKS